jgi:hypothetical protein
MRLPVLTLGTAALAIAAAALPAAAQPGAQRDTTTGRRAPTPRAEPLIRAFGLADMAPDRAVIGITLGESGTRGIRVDEVAGDGPAAQAGIKAGDYLTGVGDVSLRLAAADVDDPVLRTTAERRLRRALERVEAGDEVALRVATGEAERTVRVRTVRADRLEPAREAAGRMLGGMGAWGGDPDRATLGVSVAATGTVRDTLGAFVMSVVPGSPAERAGIVEGARIASVNGVELRVDRADVEDDAVAAARTGRLEEQLRRATAGDEVALRVYADGRWRDVRVRTAKASEVYPEGMRMLPGGMLRVGPGGTTIFRMAPGAPGRTFVLPGGEGRRFEIVAPEGRWEGRGPRVRVETAPRVRVFRDGGPDVRVEVEGLESLEPEIRERIERRMEEVRRRLRPVELRSRDARLRAVTD